MTQWVWFEDFAIDAVYEARRENPVTEEDIIRFASEYDPQYFHTDPERAKKSLFGGLVASGWHTAAMTMRMIVDGMPPIKGGLIGRGIEKGEWPMPVRAGDTLTLQMTLIEKRISQSNPALGLLRFRGETRNQKGEAVLRLETVIFAPVKAGQAEA